MRIYQAELHIHTVLSPCAEVEMIPPLIVQKALKKGINLIAITDHNATANIIAVQKAAEGTELTVLPGMEVQTQEEVHSLCIFDHIDQALTWQKYVSNYLPAQENRANFFGEQFVVDETGNFIRSESQLLSTSVEISLREAWEMVNSLGGLFIPAHVNRQLYGLLPTLGMLPIDISLEALEISRQLKLQEAIIKYPQISNLSLLKGGDVHTLEDFLGVNEFSIEKPTIYEIRLALQFKNGRSYRILE